MSFLFVSRTYALLDQSLLVLDQLLLPMHDKCKYGRIVHGPCQILQLLAPHCIDLAMNFQSSCNFYIHYLHNFNQMNAGMLKQASY